MPGPIDRASMLEHLVDSVTDYAIFTLDVEGNVSSWNPGAERIKGYRADEIIGRHVSVFYSADDVAAGRPEAELAAAVADGRSEDLGWRVRKDGTPFWANAVITAIRGDGGELLGFGKVTRDLTEQRRSDEALRSSEERFRLLVSGVADYAIYLLTPDGHVASWNLGAERLKGYTADDAIGRHFSVFYTDEDQAAGLPAVGLGTALAEGRWEQEGWRVRRDGTRFWANVVLTTLRGTDGQVRGFAKVTRDLTDRKRHEDALRDILEREREAAAGLRRLDQMKTDLVAIIAHDLRAPVDLVQHLLQLADDDGIDADRRHELLDRAQSRTARLGALVDDILDLARIESGRLDVESGPVDVARIAADVAADVAESTGRTIDVRADDGAAVGNEGRTRQVLTNLIVNATNYSPDGTAIAVCVERRGDDVVVSVEDHGPGIPVDQQPRLFQRFSRLRSEADVVGSGMGLFIAKALVEAQGGRIWCESAEGRGATFSFTLPGATP